MFWSSDKYTVASVEERLELGCPADTRGYDKTPADVCTLMRGFPLAYPNSAQLIEEGFVKFTVGFGLIVAFLLNVGVFYWNFYIEQSQKGSAPLTPRVDPDSGLVTFRQVGIAVDETAWAQHSIRVICSPYRAF